MDPSENPPTRLDDSTPEQEQIAQLLRLAGPRPPVPTERAARVRSAVHAEWQRDLRARSYRAGWTRGALALAALLLAGVGLVLWQRQRPRPIVPIDVATVEKVTGALRADSAENSSLVAGSVLTAGLRLSTGPEDRAALRLHNGTSLRVNVATRFQLVAEDVLYLERGGIYLDSPVASGGAVEIRTPFGNVREIGTQFEVRVRPEALRVRVREGVVLVGESEEASAGVELTVQDGGDVVRGSVPLFGSEWDWVLRTAPDLAIEGRTVGEFLDQVVRETRWQLRFTDDATADLASTVVLHGTAAGMTPDEAPAAILPTCGLTSRLEGGVLVVGRGDL